MEGTIDGTGAGDEEPELEEALRDDEAAALAFWGDTVQKERQEDGHDENIETYDDDEAWKTETDTDSVCAASRALH